MTAPLPQVHELRPALESQVTMTQGRAGSVALFGAGEAHCAEPPILLVHSVNAAASAFEVRPLFLAYSASRPTYALDLPGFGLSDRSDRKYTPRLMTDAIHQALEEVQARHGGVAVDAVAASLACEFLARAAAERPAAFRSLSLVSPTAFEKGSHRRGPPGSTRELKAFYALLTNRPWSRPLFRGLTRPSVVRYFLARTWGGPSIDEELWRYAVETATVAGAEHAPLCFLSGVLFSADINLIYEQLTLPVWVAHGIRGDFKDFRLQSEFAARPNWRFQSFPTGALPYFEVLEDFLRKQAAALSWPVPTGPVA